MTRRGLAVAALFCVMLAACGHYGPPVPPAPKEGEAASPQPSMPKTDEDTKRHHHEP